MTPDRTDRVAAFIRLQLAEVIRNKMNDPRLPLLTVTDVRVSRDLAFADVYVSALEPSAGEREGRSPSQETPSAGAGREHPTREGRQQPDAKADMVAVLNHAAGFLRSGIARRHDLRTTPKLRFHHDELADEAPRLEALIDHAVRADAAPLTEACEGRQPVAHDSPAQETASAGAEHAA